jgi:hypothetical protein
MVVRDEGGELIGFVLVQISEAMRVGIDSQHRHADMSVFLPATPKR